MNTRDLIKATAAKDIATISESKSNLDEQAKKPKPTTLDESHRSNSNKNLLFNSREQGAEQLSSIYEIYPGFETEYARRYC